jgi:hypothetical protein
MIAIFDVCLTIIVFDVLCWAVLISFCARHFWSGLPVGVVCCSDALMHSGVTVL